MLLLFSVITLAREGSVGKSIAFLFRVLVGNLEPVLSIVLIYIAVYHFMIRRQWPTGWSVKASGLALFLLGWMVSLHNGLFAALMPEGGYTGGWIVSQTWEVLKSHMTGGGLEFTADAGGGMIGGLSYAAIYVLFGTVGAKLIQFALYAIGILLFTGWSYVQIIGAVRRFAARVLGRLGRSTRETFQLLSDRGATAGGGAVTKRKAKPEKADVALDDEFDEENWKPDKPQKKTWFHKLSGFGDGEKSARDVRAQEDDENDDVPAEEVVYRAPEKETPIVAKPMPTAEPEPEPAPEERHEPVFVDFLDHVRESVQRAAGFEPE
ncbi:MAG TPA: hypothetical protein VEZ72_06205, partial [Paenibacillus sp.]|nr:hypothetical protein [Paenibacillus sp.]